MVTRTLALLLAIASCSFNSAVAGLPDKEDWVEPEGSFKDMTKVVSTGARDKLLYFTTTGKLYHHTVGKLYHRTVGKLYQTSSSAASPGRAR